MTVPAVVTVHVWHVPPRNVPRALVRMATDRRRLAAQRPRPLFAKLLGTADGRTFAPHDADLTTWALVATWSEADDAEVFDARHPTPRAWSRLAADAGRLDLRPLSSRGRWSRRAPFGDPAPASYDGPVAALTRARLRPGRAVTFWRAVPPVAAASAAAAGRRWSLGIGEAPLGYQGTLSVWESRARMQAFSRGPEHRVAIRRTREVGWYAEELFATFAVVAASGSLAHLTEVPA